MGISDQFTVRPWSSSIDETDYDTDSTIVPLKNPRPRDRTVVKTDSGETIEDSKTEKRRRIRSATSSVSTPGAYEYEWGVRPPNKPNLPQISLNLFKLFDWLGTWVQTAQTNKLIYFASFSRLHFSYLWPQLLAATRNLPSPRQPLALLRPPTVTAPR